MTELSIVLVNHNGGKCLPSALSALRVNTISTDAECIVVDSGSSDGSWQGIEQWWDRASALRFEANIGFCAGCNRGAEAARGHFLAFVNFDGQVEPAWDQPLLELLARPDVAVAGGVLVRPDGQTLEAAGLAIAPNTATYGRQEGAVRYSIRRQPFAVSAVSGALMMVRRTDFLSLGGFYEPIWMYGEEADYCLRVRGQIMIHPASAIRHEMGHAAGPLRSPLRLYWSSRNRIINSARHLPVWALVKSLVISAIFDLRMLAQLRSRSATKMMARAWWDGLRNIRLERKARTADDRSRSQSQMVTLRDAIRQQRMLDQLRSQ